MADDKEGLDELFSATYEELRRLASSVRGNDPSETLNPTALVNEAYVKLAASLRLQPQSRLHFKRIAARAMRQVLVEAARRRQAEKRGGGVALVTFDDSVEPAAGTSEAVLALDGALDDLARMNPRQAMMVEYRFFGGLDLAETAQVLEVSESTILRDWRSARAWLGSELRRAR
jgi:RNA polymerase sigma factor (TIGR02999 family)